MLHCNKYTQQLKETMTIDFESIKERLREMFPNQYKSDIEQYIESKNPKNAADVEHYMKQWTYSSQKYQGL
jgi:hypothetical protein